MKRFLKFMAALGLLTALGACAASIDKIATAKVSGATTDQIFVVRTGNGPNDGVSGLQLVGLDTKTGQFRAIGDTVQGETLTAGLGKSAIGAYGIFRSAGVTKPMQVNNQALGGAGGNAWSSSFSYAQGGFAGQSQSQMQLQDQQAFANALNLNSNTNVLEAYNAGNIVKFRGHDIRKR